MSQNSCPTILFDLDGTLIDSTTAILSGFNGAFEYFSLPNPKDEQICSLIGYPLEDIFAKLNAPSELIPNLIDKYKEIYRLLYLENTTLLPNVNLAIQTAAKFADLGVVTTKTSKYSSNLLENLGILKYFKILIGRDDVINPKPNPEPILKALEILNKPKQNAFMVGDTNLDINCAKNAGISAVAVSCGYESKENLQKIVSIVKDDALQAVLHIQNCVL